MANWLTNNQGSGSTESGAYTFSGEGIGAVTAITRDLSNPNQVFIPTSNEWFKAAYHQPASRGGDTDNFWRFATQSNIVPILAIATPTGDIANPGPNVVNYDFGSDWNEQNGNVTTVGSAGNTSFYGAFDMSGNVWEWNEDSFFAGDNLQRGGSFTNIAQFGIGSDFWSSGPPAVEQVNSGFRFASPALPPPCIADFNNDGSLDFFDVSGFLGAFNVQSHQADIAAPFGVLNFFDVAAYIGFFGQGCP